MTSPASPTPSRHAAANATADTRARFVRTVYRHLGGGIAVFAAASWWLHTSGVGETIAGLVIATNWLLILGGFMLVSYLATSLAASAERSGGGYVGYGLLIAANALLFATPIHVAIEFADVDMALAVGITGAVFGVLTVVGLTTVKDLSAWGGILKLVGLGVLGLIVASVLFGWQLGVWFIGGMLIFSGAAILYETQQVLRRYPVERPVPAAMTLFSSVALLFWYVLMLLMRR